MRKNHLLGQLREAAVPALHPTDPAAIAAAVAVDFTVPDETHHSAEGGLVATALDRLRPALAHLVQDALDALSRNDAVAIRVQRRGNRFVIDVIDHRARMDDGFIGDELFVPLRFTKAGGHGVGMFQPRKLEVVSRPGAGTTMGIIRLSEHSSPAAPPAAA